MLNDPKKIFKEITSKEIRSCEFIPDGITNLNYLINNAYVLRIPKENVESLMDYGAEKTTYTVIEDLKISEKLLFLDTTSGVKLTKYLHNTHMYKILSDEEIIYVSKALKKLHTSNKKVPYGYKMFNRLEDYKKNIPEKYYINESYEKRVIKEVTKIFSKDELCLCHNDLVKGNLLFKFNCCFLIDWEMAGLNNPNFDLASFISENNLNEEQKELFLKKYFGYKYNSLKKKRVEIFIYFQDILFYYWAMSYYFKRNDKVYLDIAKEKRNRITTNSLSL